MNTSGFATLRLRALNVAFGATRVFDNLTLPDLSAAGITALLGPNGCGKSTLLKSIAGLVPATCHALTLGASDLKGLDAAARSKFVRYLPQAAFKDVHLTVREAVTVAGKIRRSAAERRLDDVVDETLRDLGLAALSHRYLDELSGGQKQLVGLAQALIHQPTLLLLDEPLASLDPNHQIHVMSMLTRLASERAVAVIVVLHDLDMALRFADHIWLLRGGRLIAAGIPADVISSANIAQAFGVTARVENDSLGQPHVFVDDPIQL
ncbi:MAG TPA: ABC transporter ATP-binding protein [Burkholderiaceae bacterium]|nr:ABC transporter ATP-binding protein [Burkholderiaceae bacterium]